MEKAQRVRLQDLRQSEDAAQLVSSRRNANCKQRVASFRGGDEMADGANSANPRHEGWHLRKRTTFAKFLESAELCDVEMRVFHHSVGTKVKRDLRVPLDPGYRVDNNRLVGNVRHVRFRTASSR